MFIQEFYSNIHGIDSFVPQFATTFKGTRIVVTPNLIFKVLHVDAQPRPEWKTIIDGLRSTTRRGDAPVQGPLKAPLDDCMWSARCFGCSLSLSGGGYLSTFGSVVGILAKF